MLILSAAIILFIFILSLHRPVLGVMALFPLLPSYLLKIEILPVPTTALELATYAAAFGTLLAYYYKADFRTQVNERLAWVWHQKRGFVYAILFFFVIMLLATFMSVDLRRSAGVFKGWIFDPMLAATLLFLTLDKIKHIHFISVSTSMMMAVLSIHGLIEFSNQDRLWQSIIGYPFRIDSIFTSANSFAMLAGPIIILALGLLLFDKSLRKKRILSAFLIALTILNTIAFFLTYSYAGYLGVGLAILWLSFQLGQRLYKRKNQKVTAVILLGIVVVGLGSALFYTLRSPKFYRDFYMLQERSSLRGRMEVWGAAQKALADDPFFGWGLGNFDKAYMVNIGEVTSDPLEEIVIHAHNLFLNFWIEAGILGLLALLLVLIYAARLHVSTRERVPEISFAAGAMLLTLVVHGLLDTTYYKNDISYIFWLPIALLLFASYFSQHSHKFRLPAAGR